MKSSSTYLQPEGQGRSPRQLGLKSLIIADHREIMIEFFDSPASAGASSFTSATGSSAAAKIVWNEHI